MSKVNQSQRAGIGWEVLVSVSQRREFIGYGELASQIGIHHRPLRYVLGVIQDFCLANHLPPLTILVVNQSGLPGEGFVAWDVDNIEEGLDQVYNFNWGNLENPFGFARNGLTEEEIITALLDKPSDARDIYALIKVRGAAQPIFRKALLEAYENECAICGFSFPVALQASHIIPWNEATKDQRLDIRNGLLLCSTHHRLFDCGLFTVNDDYSINYYDAAQEGRKYSTSDIFITVNFNNRKLKLPKEKKHWPEIEYLMRHRKRNIST